MNHKNINTIKNIKPGITDPLSRSVLLLIAGILLFGMGCGLPFDPDKKNPAMDGPDMLNRAADRTVPGCPLSDFPQISNLQSAVGDLYTEQNRLNDNIKDAKKSLETIKSKIKTAKSVCEKIIKIKKKIDNAKTMTKVLSPLPYVGAVAKSVDTVLKIIKKPLDTAYPAANKALTALKKAEAALEKGIEKLEKAEAALDKLALYIQRTDMVICLAENCVTAEILNSLANEITDDIDRAAGIIEDVNDTIDEIRSYIKKTQDYLDFLSSGFIRKFDNVLNYLDDLLEPLEELYDSLNIELCIPVIGCLDLIDVLKSSLGLIGDLISPILDPILDSIMDIFDIPVPGFPDLSSFLDLVNFPELKLGLDIPIPLDPCSYIVPVKDCIPLEYRDSICP